MTFSLGFKLRLPSARILAVTLGMPLLLISALCAQDVRGGLRGIVSDPSGGRIVSANIKLTDVQSGLSETTASDSSGEFRFQNLSPGTKRVEVLSNGFTPSTVSVVISSGATATLRLVLHANGAATTVEVRSGAPSVATQPLDLENAVHQTAISAQDLTEMPLPARSFANIAYLAPGTEPVEPSDPTKARITAVSTGGSSGLNNDLSVDGGDNSDDYIGGFLQNFSPESIQQFSFRTAQEDADTGRTTAGSVVITTRRGSNELHGEAAFFERDASLNARFPIENPAPNPKQPFSRQNIVGSVGGPIVRDKLWFFASGEFVRENASIAYSPANLQQFQALSTLATEGLIPGVTSIAVPPSVTIPFRDFLGTVRFDWTQSQRSQWFLRTSADSYITHNALVQQGTLPSTGLIDHNNYVNAIIGNEFVFNSRWLASFVFDASLLHLTQQRNQTLGFALAFPFSSTAQTVSGFETFGDNQFATPITLFPSQRYQQKYQLRYDISHVSGAHSVKFGVNFIHEPVLGGAFPGNQETLYLFPLDPTQYLGNPSLFSSDLAAGASTTPASDGSFQQNIQRLGLYAQDTYHPTPRLTVNYGLRYDTTFGLFRASGRNQFDNPALLTLQALQIPLEAGVPHDDRAQFGPRLGIAYALGRESSTVIRSGFGLYFNDLAQNGWVTAFQAVNTPALPCTNPLSATPGAGCVPGAALGGSGNLIDSNYKSPYALHATAGVEHAFNSHWMASADFTHEEGNHAYRGYSYAGGVNLFTPLLPATDLTDQQNVVPDINLFKSDNRSSYNALMLHLQGSMPGRFSLIANYTLSSAKTWGCVLGELFDYVNGVCNPLQPFAAGDYGPSGEDVRHRVVVAGTLNLPKGFFISSLTQLESARPFTITTADNSQRIAVNGATTPLDAFRGTPYIQADLRVSRPINFGDRYSLTPFIEFFNLFNRNNAGANYVTNVASLANVPAAEAQAGNITSVCADPSCSTTRPLRALSDLAQPAGALGDFFGPGTTVGIPFAAQVGARFNF